MRVFLTGGTGFVGSHLLRALLEGGHRVDCLVRPGGRGRLAPLPREARPVPGDLLEPESYRAALAGCDAVVHLVGIIRPRRGAGFERVHVVGTGLLVEAARQAGAGRFVYVSALGARPGGTAYQRTKAAAEERVRQGGLPFTILRPSIVFGPGDAFVNLLARLIKLLPVVPVFGDGRYELQPVAVRDVVTGLVAAAEGRAGQDRAFDVGGPDAIAYGDLLELVAAALDRRARTVRVPLPLVRPVVTALEGLPFFPLTRDQLRMLLEGNTCDPRPYFQAFGIQRPLPFGVGIREYLDP